MDSAKFAKLYKLSDDGQYFELRPEFKEQYRKSLDQQVQSWLAGVPLHNAFSDECCPDFSCCNGGKMWPVELRQKFINSSEDTRLTMLGMALEDLTLDQDQDQEQQVYLSFKDKKH